MSVAVSSGCGYVWVLAPLLFVVLFGLSLFALVVGSSVLRNLRARLRGPLAKIAPLS